MIAACVRVAGSRIGPLLGKKSQSPIAVFAQRCLKIHHERAPLSDKKRLYVPIRFFSERRDVPLFPSKEEIQSYLDRCGWTKGMEPQILKAVAALFAGKTVDVDPYLSICALLKELSPKLNMPTKMLYMQSGRIAKAIEELLSNNTARK